MKVITAPERYEIQPNDICCFLAGGISGCPEWQQEVIKHLKDNPVENLVIFNPRRKEFHFNKLEDSIEQIKWEFEYLNKVDIFSIYFCKDSIQPICMYELGRYIEVMKRRFPDDYLNRIIISVERNYPRAMDVIYQVSLALDDNDDDNIRYITASVERHAMDINETARSLNHDKT